jgi:hypothetical protein
MLLCPAVGGTVTPEEPGDTELSELVETTAHLLQQPILVSLGRETLERVVEALQISMQRIELLSRTRELLFERLFVVGS